MNRKPPSEIDRLRLFVDLADHYIAACDVLPLEMSTTVTVAETVPLALEIRLMLMRKFVEQERGQDGNVHLRRIAVAFGECFTGDSPIFQENLARYAAEVDSLLKGKTGVVVNGRQDDNVDVLYDALYGRLMHADWGRWQTHSGRLGFVARMALTDIWQKLDHLVREAHYSVSSAFEAGQLTEPD